MKFIKSKEFMYLILIIFVVVVATILFFFPDVIENRYPYSYENITAKKDKIEQNNSTLKQNQSQIGSSINTLEDMKVERNMTEDRALEVRKGIKESDFELKISSILISLEQRAYENNADLIIGYSAILHINGAGGVQEYDYPGGDRPDKGKPITSKPSKPDKPKNPEELDELEELEKPKDPKDKDNSIKIEGKPEENAPETEEPIEKEPAFSQERLEQGTINIEGIDVVVIPIIVEGSYYNVRNYIKYLDQIGMIEPSSLVLQSTGNKIKAEIILNVFHGEVGL